MGILVSKVNRMTQGADANKGGKEIEGDEAMTQRIATISNFYKLNENWIDTCSCPPIEFFWGFHLPTVAKETYIGNIGMFLSPPIFLQVLVHAFNCLISIHPVK